jgi:starvation-inducible outer membrane lipoprotein
VKCIGIIALLFLLPACTTAPDPHTRAFEILNQSAP